MSRVGLLLILASLLVACHDSAKEQAQSQQLAEQTEGKNHAMG